LDAGNIVKEGDPAEVVSGYLNEKSTGKLILLKDRKDRQGNGKLRMVDTWIVDENNNRVSSVVVGQTITICVRYQILDGKSVNGLKTAIAINSLGNIQLSLLSNTLTGDDFDDNIVSDGIIKCKIKKLPLNKGSFVYNIMFRDKNNDILDYLAEAGRFVVVEGDYYGTGKTPESDRLFLMNHNWEISIQ